MKIYLASPLGFSEAGRLFYYEKLIPTIESAGHEVLDPWVLTDLELIKRVQALDYGPEKRTAWQNLNVIIGANNREAIDRCQAVVAVLDGPDVDSGTAAEIGYAYGLGGRVIFGYRNDFRLSADNEGGVVNLQVEYFITASGGQVVRDLAALHGALRSTSTSTLGATSTR